MVNYSTIVPEELRVIPKVGTNLCDVKIECSLLSLQEKIDVLFDFNGTEYIVRFAELRDTVREIKA